VAFSPQLDAWKILCGRWLTAGRGLGDVLFRPDRSLDLSSPHLLSVLFSADRGLFSWTPGLLLGLVAFLLGLRRWGLVGAGGLLVLVPARASRCSGPWTSAPASPRERPQSVCSPS